MSKLSRDLIAFLCLTLICMASAIHSVGAQALFATAGLSLFLFYHVGRPWKLIEGVNTSLSQRLYAPVLLLALGTAIDLLLIVGIAWTWAIWRILSPRLREQDRHHVFGLLLFPILALPWIVADFHGLAWWYRLSGAQVVEFLFNGVGISVLRQGTQIVIDDLIVSVKPACAGLGTLQLMWIAAAGALAIERRKLVSPLVLLTLVVLSWIANTSRVTFLTSWALLGGDVAPGSFSHDWGGAFMVLAVFLFLRMILLWKPQKEGAFK